MTDASTQYRQQNPAPARGSGSSSTRAAAQPIGVPQGYQPPYPDAGDQNIAYNYGTPPAATPLYYAGAEWGTTPNFPTDYAGVAQLQQLLIRAGYLNPKATIVGQWDQTSASAYAQLLGSANQAGVDWQTALARSLSSADQTAALAAKSKTPLVVSLTNPDDIRAAVEKVNDTLHGGNLSPDEMAKFIANYQGMESQYQTGHYTATGYDPVTGQQDPTFISGTPGGAPTTDVKPPDLGVEADLAVRKMHPDQVFVSALGNALSGLQSTIAGTTPGGRTQ